MKTQRQALLFDWGDTLMRDFSEFNGPMYTWPRVEIVPYADEVLAKLCTDWVLAIATNATDSNEQDIRAALQRVGINHLIEKIYCFREIGYKKPSLEFFEYIMQDLQTDRSHVIMVGDNFEKDILGANHTGIRGVWFNERSDDVKHSSMYHTIHDLRSLPQALRDLQPEVGS